MFTAKLLMSGLVALGLALTPTAILAAEPHAHGATVEIKLNNGEKWPTDAVLRRGMGEIRNAMADALEPIHRDRFTVDAYQGLAARIQTQVDDVVANCQLPEDADQQLHLILEEILDGIAAMKEPTGTFQGAVKVVRALELYGAHFDHGGWQPLEH